MHYISKMTVLGAEKGRISIYKNVTCLSNYLYTYLICLDMYLTDRIKKKYCKFLHRYLQGLYRYFQLINFTFTIKAGIKM